MIAWIQRWWNDIQLRRELARRRMKDWAPRGVATPSNGEDKSGDMT